MRNEKEMTARQSTGAEDTPRFSRRQLIALLAGTTTGFLASSTAWAALRVDDASTHPGAVQAFLQAVTGGALETVGHMLDQDVALARATDSDGRSAYVLAKLSRHEAIADTILKRGIELDAVEAVLAKDWERLESLAAENPAVMNAAHPIGGNPLYASALTGGGEQYRIRSLGTDPDGRPAGGSGLTPARAAMDCREPLGAWLAGIDILSNGGSANAPQAHGNTVLHGAVYAKDARLVGMVIRKEADVAATDANGRTALQLAEYLDWVDGVELLQNQSSIHRDYRGSRFAFDANREAFTLLSIEDIPGKTQSEITGLSHFDEERVQTLLDDEPRLAHAISTDAELAIEACGHTGRRDIMRIHLDCGAPLSLPTAISFGDLDHARWLLENDPLLVHERGPHDFPVMWYPAIGGGSVDAAALLLEFGAPLEQESGGETALHWAALRGHADLTSYLLEQGANSQALGYRQDRKGITPLQLAIAKKRSQVSEILQASERRS